MTSWRGTGPRLVALLLAAVVSAAATFSADNGARDACAETCVADCFCCSRGETAGPARVLPGLTALAQAPSPDPASVPSVVRPVPEPPPLALS